ncbi:MULTISPECIES: HAMP domain-containing sensor histidine kinase [Hydrocarboniphaga]|uniref:sensor histidine kinase n=1 Tax=Hydrocarboniphaga TaxID=243627 RepID=UPI002ABBAA7C|nr:HAMP domain-containing sensor histidine kinase [Hydrocarboniphaga sp.]MDZ4077862.1 HAMP domain-containing sensor histidine kinase [Hydrocarboniphaga sp.]
MRLKLSLRVRFSAAVLFVAVLLSAGFYYAVDRAIELIEFEVQEQALSREVDAIHRQVTGAVSPVSSRTRVFIVQSDADLENVPPPLHELRPGARREFKLDGRRYIGTRRDIGETRVLVAQDIEEIELLEHRLVNLATVLISIALLIAAVVGLLLARAVIKPVTRLAQAVTSLSPEHPGARIGSSGGDPEIDRIAEAFDRFLDRLDTFVTRERAFTDQASHELRTPVAIIDSASELLKRSPNLDPQSLERVARIQRAAAQMHSLIEALLFLARADGGSKSEPIELGAVLQDACDGYRQLLTGRDLTLTCETPAAVTVMAPRGMLLCVINNLVGNAISHTQQGEVSVRLDAQCFVVQDSGPGIAEQDLPRIFEMGFRGCQSRGSGLGLHIVHRICEQLNWRIEVASGQSTGARFTVWFGPSEL